ncbi:cysteine hydrolase family protein [Nocardiopsis lambiniae]|uniref:Isochorismatase family cysteine hydrolase n=1 Tax=Nocardiopsis lambiniae TaxID=3075539 RepID=A0ABU2M2Q9_9ACTN|nr:isochorismatase family cysteine hydrolase [Nocardiopsis sp. DSM 44743]MDT0326928.1 isochorismatase family cysteine hydrolase [Nocardiopsis sp. DSM 44743]
MLVVDLQRDFADPDRLSWIDAAGRDRVAAAVAGTRRLVERARAAGVRVVWVRLEQDLDEPWDASRWHRGLVDIPRERLVEREPCVADTPGAEWFALAPREDEEVVVKRRYSAFHGTDLARGLYSGGTSWVVVCGLTADCCVDATSRDAFQHGFRVVVTADATASYEEDRQRAAMRALSMHAAVVTTVDDITAHWPTGP